jgi:hypothetical protein
MELLLFWVIMAVICGIVAASKNRSFFLYFMGGLFLWPIVLVVALVARPEGEHSELAIKAAAAEAARLPPPPPADTFRPNGAVGGRPALRQGVIITVMLDGRPVQFPDAGAVKATFGQDFTPFWNG